MILQIVSTSIFAVSRYFSPDLVRKVRLLKYNNDDKLSLTQFFDDIPQYAILSHTWGPDEVTYRDMMEGSGKDKTGFNKIRYCGEQAKLDGLQYFWVDTCCIDKSSSAELSEALNSMFRWYRYSSKCYAFLSDVSHAEVDINNQSHLPWKSAFRRSRWFTRGWTLQELIAPKSVEVFSSNWELLGNKKSLETYICEITEIPSKALRDSVFT
jgi:hypothetical protein